MPVSRLIVDEVVDVNNNKLTGVDIMSKAEYDAVKESNKALYGSAGQVSEATSFDNFIIGDSRGDNILFHNRSYPSNRPNISWLALGVDTVHNSTGRANVYYNVAGRTHHFYGMGGNVTPIPTDITYGTTTRTPGIPFPQPDLPKAESNGGSLANSYKAGDLMYLNEPPRELIANGTFTNDIAGWTPWGGTANITWSLGQLVATPATVATGDWFGTKYSVNILNTGYNKLTFNVSLTNITTLRIWFLKNAATLRYVDLPGSTTLANVDVPSGEFDTILIYCTESIAGQGSFTLDNVSITTQGESNLVCLKDTAAGAGVNDVFQAFAAVDSLSRQDFMFLESWEEDVSALGMVYPLGNVQYDATDSDGLTGIAQGAFTGADTYSLYGNWEAPNDYVGKGYIWNNLTDAERGLFVANPDNNIYTSNAKVYQARYRTRVIKGYGNYFNSVNSIAANVGASAVNNYNSNNYLRHQGPAVTVVDMGVTTNSILNVGGGKDGYDGAYGLNSGTTQSTPIALVQRRNTGIYHPSLNPHGAAMVVSAGVAKLWHEVTTLLTPADCLNPANIAVVDITAVDPLVTAVPLTSLTAGTVTAPNFAQTGLVLSLLTARPDSMYADEINIHDVIDKRVNGRAITDYEGFLEDEFRKYAEGGKETGVQGEYFWKKQPYTSSVNGLALAETLPSQGVYGYRLVIPHNNIDTQDVFAQSTTTFRYRPEHNSIGSCIIVGDNGKVYIAAGVIHYAHGNGNTYIEPGGPVQAAEVAKFNRLFPVGTVLSYYIATESTHKAQGYIVTCDIIGEPGKLDDRVKFTVAAGVTQVVNLLAGDVVLKGGTYYTALLPRTAIDLNLDVMTTAANWSNCGVNGAIGGYPAEWFAHGVMGVPNLSTMDNKFTSLASNRFSTKGAYRIPLNATHINGGYYVDKVIMIRNGVTTVVPGNASYVSVINIGGKIEQYVSIYTEWLYINLTTTATFDPILEAETIIQVFYRTVARLTDNSITGVNPYLAMTKGHVGVFTSKQHGRNLTSSLLDKYSTSVYGSVPYQVSWRFSIGDFTTAYGVLHDALWSVKPKHQPLTPYKTNESSVKVLPVLTNTNGLTYMALYYKEMKWDVLGVNQDGTPTNTLGDDGSFNGTGVTTVKDLNGNDVACGAKYIPLRRFIK